MKYFFSLFFGALFFCGIFPSFASAAVRINEVAWMGTAASQYSEWIELYNDGDSDISLAGWTIYKTANELLFTLSKTISAGGYLLVERTTASAPDAVPGINDESGTFSNGGLRNSGEDLTLKDQNGNPINILPYAGGWPAGDTKTKDTMQWTGEKWITAPGTPDAINATVADSAPTSAPSSSSSQASSPEVTAPVVSETITTTPVVTPTPIIDPPVSITTPPASTPTSSTSPSIATQDAQQPGVASSTTPVAAATIDPIQMPDAAVPVAKKSVVTKTVAKKSAVAKSSAKTASGEGTDTAANDTAADQLGATADTPKENNHLKIIIFGAVAFIGTALFLLLDRLKSKVSQE